MLGGREQSGTGLDKGNTMNHQENIRVLTTGSQSQSAVWTASTVQCTGCSGAQINRTLPTMIINFLPSYRTKTPAFLFTVDRAGVKPMSKGCLLLCTSATAENVKVH